MTAHRDLKNIIRDRMGKTGEPYSAARLHVMRAKAERDDGGVAPAVIPGDVLEAVVLKVNAQSARVRVAGEVDEVTFRSADVYRLVPGHVATLSMKRRWTHRGYAYASGKVKDARIDIERLGLAPLPLEDQGLADFTVYEPYTRPDPYAPLWKKLTTKPRPSFEMHAIAWDAIAHISDDPEDTPVCDAAELREAGDIAGATKLLMEVLAVDLRCIDAHVHLGNIAFRYSPSNAMVHYQIGLGIGEQSLGPGFEGVLLWGCIYNRPFLRCLHGYGLCLWRLGRPLEAEQVFERILSLNPPDNQGVRFCLADVRKGRTWAESYEDEPLALH